MSDVHVPELSITIFVEGDEVAVFAFNRTDRHPQDWEVTAALRDPDSRTAIRACLLACIGELNQGNWEHYDFEVESGDTQDDQLQLPWS